MLSPKILTRAGMILAGGLLAADAIACAAQHPLPVRSPLAEPPGAAATVPPIVTAIPTVRAEVPPPTAQVEPAAARAVALLAEWLAVPQRELAVVHAEALAWPSSCLGVQQPGVLCAAVITPGFRVLVRDRVGGLHSVHSDADSGGARWAGETMVTGTLTSIDRVGQRVTLDVEGRPLVLRLTPGTQWLPSIALAGGARVVVGYDPSGSADVAPATAWIASV